MYFSVKIETYRRGSKAIICYNCSGFHHIAKNCKLKSRCIKCNGSHATRDCIIKEKIEEKLCINCNAKDHLAGWYGCKAIPIIPNRTKTGKISYAEAARKSNEKNNNEKKIPGPTESTQISSKQLEETNNLAIVITELKNSLDALKDIKKLLQEFPTLLEAAKRCKETQDKKEKTLIVLNALLGD